MSNTLYRKYRPQLFDDLISQEVVKQTLQNEIKSGHIAHAYLFSGPRGLGKTTTARLLAKAINCQKRKADQYEPCNTCDNCQAITLNRSLDLIEIDAASNRGINEIRGLKEHIGFTPAGSNYRVFIIDEVHMLTTEAFNALLKTLEEPPEHAVFILATTELHKVPETVISRCQTFTFRRVKEKDLVKRLEKISKAEGVAIDLKVLAQVAHLSGGFIRDAESMLGQLVSLGEKKITQDLAALVLPISNISHVVNFLNFLQTSQITEALKHINSITDEGVDLEYFSKELLEALRQLLISEYGSIENIDEHLRDLQGKFEVKQLLQLISLVDRAILELKRTGIPQLPLELVVVEFLQNSETISDNKDVNDSSDRSGDTALLDSTEKINEKETKPQTNASKQVNTKKEDKIEVITNDNKNSAKVSFADIQKKWSEVIEVSKVRNPSLTMSLNTAHLLGYDKKSETGLEIGFMYELHVTRLGNQKTKQALEQILEDIFGGSISVTARLFTEEEAAKFNVATEEETAKDEQFISDALETFGGQIVTD